MNQPSLHVCSHIIDFSFFLGLSTREAAVLVLAAGAGVNRKEVAYHLGCRPGTVDTYWQRILRKCALGSQLEVFAALLAFTLENCGSDGTERPARRPETTKPLRDPVVYRATIDSAIRGTLDTLMQAAASP